VINNGEKRPTPNWLSRARFFVGYILFGGVIFYALRRAPEEVWKIAPSWLILALCVIVLMLLLQWSQVIIFLRAQGVKSGWYWPLMFTVKKGVLNAVLPAKSGTLVLMHMLTQHYPVRWHDYLRFSLTAGIASLIISAIALAWLVLSNFLFSLVLITTLVGCYVASRAVSAFYMASLPMLLLNGLGQYMCVLLIFWSILGGLGYPIGLRDASYFSVTLNTLAQLTLTPGNIGVREAVMGMLAPYIALPVAVGIIAGGVFHVLRTTVYAIVLAALSWCGRAFPGLRRVAPSGAGHRSN
jgi:hypothetical protein